MHNPKAYNVEAQYLAISLDTGRFENVSWHVRCVPDSPAAAESLLFSPSLLVSVERGGRAELSPVCSDAASTLTAIDSVLLEPALCEPLKAGNGDGVLLNSSSLIFVRQANTVRTSMTYNIPDYMY